MICFLTSGQEVRLPILLELNQIRNFWLDYCKLEVKIDQFAMVEKNIILCIICLQLLEKRKTCKLFWKRTLKILCLDNSILSSNTSLTVLHDTIDLKRNDLHPSDMAQCVVVKGAVATHKVFRTVYGTWISPSTLC